MNYILIGLPTAGKSTIGVVLAKMLSYDFIDTDLMIQKQEGCRLEETISKIGEEAFLDLEGDICSAIEADHAVISTGGSVIYRKHTMEHVKALGTVIYLRISLNTLKERLHDARSRGVVLKEGQTIDDLYYERIELYEQYADLVVDEENTSFEEVLNTVLTEIKRGEF